MDTASQLHTFNSVQENTHCILSVSYFCYGKTLSHNSQTMAYVCIIEFLVNDRQKEINQCHS